MVKEIFISSLLQSCIENSYYTSIAGADASLYGTAFFQIHWSYAVQSSELLLLSVLFDVPEAVI